MKQRKFQTGYSIKLTISLMKLLLKYVLNSKIFFKNLFIERAFIIAIFIIVVINGYAFGKVFDLISFKKPYNSLLILKGINVFFGISILLKNIFPVFKSVHFIKNSYYPISIFDKYFLSKAKEILSFYTILILSQLLLFQFFSSYVNLSDIIVSILIFMFFLGLNNAFRILLESKIHFTSILYIAICSINITLYFCGYYNVALLLILFLSQIVIGFISFKNALIRTKLKEYRNNIERSFNRVAFMIFFRNNKIKINLVFIFLTKIIFLLLISIGIGKFFLGWDYLVKLICLPTLFFTYIGNNMFGYTPSVYRNICLSTDNKNSLIKVYLKPFLTVILADCFVTIFALYIVNLFPLVFKHQILNLSFFYLLIYFISTLIFTNISFFFSITEYRNIIKPFSNKTNTSFKASTIILIHALLLIILLETKNTIIEITIVIFLTLLFILFILWNKDKFTKSFIINFLKT